MFKRFTIEEHVSNQSQVKSSQQRQIRNKILEQYPQLEPIIEELMPKKEPMIVAKWYVRVMPSMSLSTWSTKWS